MVNVQMTSVSLVILTWNRWPIVYPTLTANLASAGYPIFELIHVDNGSVDETSKLFAGAFSPQVQVLHSQNMGVATGYNRGFAMATGTHVALTGCDRLMPQGWLKAWVKAIECVSNTGVVSCYSDHDKDPMRRVKAVSTNYGSGVIIQPAPAMEARICSREFLLGAGFWREDFGLYGYEDAEWGDRAEVYAKKNGLINYIIPSLGLARHATERESHAAFGSPIGGLSYQEWKNKIHSDPRRRRLFAACRSRGSPHYNPYARIEPDRLDEWGR